LLTDLNFVKKDAWKERREPKRLPVADEMNLVAAFRERDTELGCNSA
jgi:hypothetical protein